MMSPAKVEKTLRRAHSHHKAGRLEQAVVLYEKVLTEHPRHAGALHFAALLGRQINNFQRATGGETRDDEVMRLMAMSIIANPHNAAGLHNFAKFKHDRGELDEAKHLYENAVHINPLQGESWYNLGNVYAERGNMLRAEAAWLRALECPRETAEEKFNVAFLRLLKGDYADGWKDFEARWECAEFHHAYGRPDITTPRWDGRALNGTLYVHGEQGAGDVLMMSRYIPLVIERVGARGTVIIEVLQALVSLFESLFPSVQIVARGDDPPAHDLNVPMFSLPAIFGTTIDTIPQMPVLSPDSRSIPMESGRIGLCWRGSTTHHNDRSRSMPFEACFPLLDVPGLAWQSLQFGYETAPPLDPLPLGDFLETARQIARCELVITVDTSVAHLAGLMGKVTYTLLPFSAEWRWGVHAPRTPWYPNHVLWRQKKPGDWRELVERVATAIAPYPHPSTE